MLAKAGAERTLVSKVPEEIAVERTRVDRDLGRGAVDKAQPAPAATPKSAKVRQPSSVERGDPFASPPEGEEVPLLARDLNHPLAEPSQAPAPPIQLDRPARATPAGSPRRSVARETVPLTRRRRRLGLVLGLGALVVGAFFAFRHFRHASVTGTPAEPRPRHRITLALDPLEASVQIDRLPAMRDDLFFDDGTSHLLSAAAPGRIPRRLSFQAKADLELSVHLGRTLALPSPDDPEPSRRELALSYPANPASRDDIDRGFAKLERYAKCLALLDDAGGGGRKGRNPVVPSNAAMSGCVQLLDKATAMAPAMLRLHATGLAYLQGAHDGARSPALRKLLADFRAEFLAVRADWQMQEVSRQEKDEGQTAVWHMRRVALAAQAWLRQSEAPSGSGRGMKERLARLDESQRALLAFAEHSSQDMAQVSGATAFMKAAQDVVTLAQGATGERPAGTAALAACRRLIAAFNALVVD